MIKKIKTKIENNEVVSIISYCVGALIASVGIASIAEIVLGLI